MEPKCPGTGSDSGLEGGASRGDMNATREGEPGWQGAHANNLHYSDGARPSITRS